MIVRNENLPQARAVMRDVEDRFNHKYKYPWVLLNNQYFHWQFRHYVSKITDAPIFFGKIDTEAWNYPRWVDIPKAEEAILNMYNIFRGQSLSYHQLLRYQAGLFFLHPLFNHAEFTWRVEPNAHYSCSMPDDPFAFMKENNKKLGFALSFVEQHEAVTTLWDNTRTFMNMNPELIKPREETIRPWILDADDAQFNMCHMWSNFEIMDLSWVRTSAYRKYFDFLDKLGGFFYERWGDPVRTIAASMFLDKSEVHFFNDIGYQKEGFIHCPLDPETVTRCTCSVKDVHGNLSNGSSRKERHSSLFF
ncbi:glycosyltransferase family 15 protein [Hesseltinella vesiculosa]|uniref:Glycosyltransferase family 15 protein n=1 Tax=Hesseltinella vesiculosa TaxID=101127 RepID=A0A1X2GYG0_9FUNG|nr:glycosyltransferase family 15 protein [Hesseltinella vesiculosa]